MSPALSDWQNGKLCSFTFICGATDELKLGVCGRFMFESCHPAVDRRGSLPALLQCGAERVDSPNACDSHLIIFSLSSFLGTLEV